MPLMASNTPHKKSEERLLKDKDTMSPISPLLTR